MSFRLIWISEWNKAIELYPHSFRELSINTNKNCYLWNKISRKKSHEFIHTNIMISQCSLIFECISQFQAVWISHFGMLFEFNTKFWSRSCFPSKLGGTFENWGMKLKILFLNQFEKVIVTIRVLGKKC